MAELYQKAPAERRQLTLDFDRHLRIDFDKGEQLTILRHVVLPAVRIKEGKTVRRVKPRDMIDVLRVLDDHGRDCLPSIPSITKEARLSRCQVLRAIAGLQALSLVCIEKRRKRGGGFTNRYVAVWSELALRCPGDTLKLRTDHRPQATNHRPHQTDHRPLATQPLSPGRDGKRPRLVSAQKSPSDVQHDLDGARHFFFEEAQGIRAKANRLHQWLRPKDQADREFILKVATLWHDRALSEDAVEQLLESFEQKSREIANPFRWAWEVLRNKFWEAGGPTFDQLLARTDYPREPLIPPTSPPEADRSTMRVNEL